MSPITTITRSKPFYVVAGAGDLAVKTIRELPAQLASGRVVAVKIGRKDVEKAVTSLRDEAVIDVIVVHDGRDRPHVVAECGNERCRGILGMQQFDFTVACHGRRTSCRHLVREGGHE